MKMIKLMFVVCLMVCVAVMTSSTALAADKFVVGLSPKALTSPFWIRVTESAKKFAKENDIKLLIVAPPSETAVMEQVNLLEDLIQQKVNLIAMGPTDPLGVVPVLQGAVDAGIPVVILDAQTPLPGLESISLIGADNIAAGRVIGEYAAKLLNGKGNLVVIEGIAGNNTGEERKLGFGEIVAKHEGMKIIASQPGNWERALGMNVMENILQSNPNVDFVFACSDEMALGAAMAVEAAGKKIPIIGVDGNKDAVIAVKEGSLEATVAQDPEKIGEYLIKEVAVKLRDGKPVEKKLSTDFQLITKENADQFLK